MRSLRGKFIAIWRLPLYEVALFVHDARKHGSELLALSICSELERRFGRDHFVVFLLDGGELESEFQRYHCVRARWTQARAWRFFSRRLNAHCRLIFNTVAAQLISDYFVSSSRSSIALIHELPTVVDFFELQAHAPRSWNCDHVVFPSDYVRDEFSRRFPDRHAQATSHVMAQGVYSKVSKGAIGSHLRAELGISEASYLIGNFAASGELRKAPDLFVQTAILFKRKFPDADVHFIWIGPIPREVKVWLIHDLQMAGCEKFMTFAEFRDDHENFCNAIDCMFLSSREDPFPATVQEMHLVGKPIVLFDRGNGYASVTSNQLNFVQYLNLEAAAKKLYELANANEDLPRSELAFHSPSSYTEKILEF